VILVLQHLVEANEEADVRSDEAPAGHGPVGSAGADVGGEAASKVSKAARHWALRPTLGHGGDNPEPETPPP
jgi:hypothetical protein